MTSVAIPITIKRKCDDSMEGRWRQILPIGTLAGRIRIAFDFLSIKNTIFPALAFRSQPMNRQSSLDLLKLVMAFMVIGIHTTFVKGFAGHLLQQGVFRIAVPIFLLISGFYFSAVLEPGKIKKWVWRVLVLYVVWTTFYAYAWWPGFSLSRENLVQIGRATILGYLHLWYLSALACAGILLYLTHKWKSTTLLLLVAMTFVAGVAIQYAGNYDLFGGTRIDRYLDRFDAHRNALFLCFPFLCIGYLIHRHSLHKKISLTSAILLLLTGLTLLLTESSLNYFLQGKSVPIDNLLSLILICPALFLFAFHFDLSIDGKTIALYASAIYFIHPLAIDLMHHGVHVNGTLLAFTTAIASVPLAWLVLTANKRVGILA